MITRKLLKIPGFLLDQMADRSPGIIVLMYHRVSGDLSLELDLPTNTFERQMEYLAEHVPVISLDEACALLEKPDSLDRDHFVLTFDDAFRDFYTTAFPTLQRHEFPATLYVPTAFVENGRPIPLSNVPDEDSGLAPCSWAMLRECASSPLITIGAHTHTHPELPSLSDENVRSEIKTSDRYFKDRLNLQPQHFAYPRGKWNARVESLAADRYATCTLVGEGWRNRPGRFSPHRMPRFPCSGVTASRSFAPKLTGIWARGSAVSSRR